METTSVEMRPAEREVLMLRYGLHDGMSRSLRDAGQACGHSGEWVRQIESAAFRRLLILARAYLAGAVLSPSQQADLYSLYPAWVEWQKTHPQAGVVD